MRKSPIYCVFLFLFINLAYLNVLPKLNYSTSKLPVYKLDLDIPVKLRYKELLQKNKFKVQAYAEYSAITPLPYIVSLYGKYLSNKRIQDPEWIEYIEAVSEFCEIPLSKAIMLSVTYDMACTSVVVQDKLNQIFLARNLDFFTYFVLTHVAFEAEYYKNGNLLYRGTEVMGFRGAVNAVKPGKFTVSLNLRYGDSKLKSLYKVFNGYPTPNFLLMKVMERANSYDEALQILSETSLSAPVYYTISGLNSNEGSIITRNRDGVYSIDSLNVDKGKWFLVITNTDLDKSESLDDSRRLETIQNIKKVGRENINYNNLFSNVMSVYPTNNILTVWTTIQSPIGYFNTTLWLP
jgi:acid ceramidase